MAERAVFRLVIEQRSRHFDEHALAVSQESTTARDRRARNQFPGPARITAPCELIFKELELQTIKNKNELGLFGADGVETDDAAGESGAAKPDRAAREPRRVNVDLAAGERGAAEADRAAGKYDRAEEIIATVQPGVDAQLSVISGAITSIDAFTTAVNATAAGARSPLAIASLNELLHKGGADGISYVLSVKALGGRSEQYTKDRHVGFDTYTTLADASVSFMLYNVADQTIIESGIANGLILQQ
jgi:hypothetical protein